ncbi:MAG: lactonase family protein [Pirellulales bacterium]|nr:lactonase family protein [Pirellulales bacterium]
MFNRILFCILAGLYSSSLFAKPFLLVSLPDEQHLAIFEINTRTGELTHVRDHKTESDPGPMSVSQDGNTLFVSLRNAGELASYAIDHATSSLKHLSTIKADRDPAYHWQDHSGKWLITAYYHTGRVSVHAVDNMGVLKQQAAFFGETALNAHGVAATNDNRFVYIPHTGPNLIVQFGFDDSTGQLTVLENGSLVSPESTGPRHLATHPKKPWLYGDYEQGNKAVFYEIKPNGLLITKQILSSVPEEWPAGKGATARMTLSADGRFMYVANRGHNSIATFKIHQRWGTLSLVGIYETEPNPRSFVISPCGKWLYAGGQDSGTIAIFSRNRRTGVLSRKGTVGTGKRPWWLQVIE